MDLERSFDGVQFETLTAGLSPVDGQYLDAAPSPGTNWYRMKVSDVDGQVQYSEIRKVEIESTEAFSFQAFPNPLQSNLTVKLDNHLPDQTYQVVLQDYLGRTLREERVQVTLGTYQFTWEQMDQLAAGVYLLKISDGQKQQVERLIRH